jgi:hypothetical protein
MYVHWIVLFMNLFLAEGAGGLLSMRGVCTNEGSFISLTVPYTDLASVLHKDQRISLPGKCLSSWGNITATIRPNLATSFCRFTSVCSCCNRAFQQHGIFIVEWEVCRRQCGSYSYLTQHTTGKTKKNHRNIGLWDENIFQDLIDTNRKLTHSTTGNGVNSRFIINVVTFVNKTLKNKKKYIGPMI